MEDTNLPIVVPFQAINDFFQCSICMCQMKAAVMTACGHRFCEKCIQEWVDRQHKCPCCNNPLQLDQLIKDHQFDSLLATIMTESKKAEDEYFESLINRASDEQNKDENLTPMEQILKKHLKQGLSAHEKYFHSLKKDFKQRKQMLESETSKGIADIHLNTLFEDQALIKTAELQSIQEKKLQELEKELSTCTKLLAEAYDKYLTDHIPNLDVLPVVVSVYLLNKNIRIEGFRVNPSDTLLAVREFVEATMEANHNPVIEWENDVKVFLFGPFAKGSQMETQKIMSDISSSASDTSDVQEIREGLRFGLQYSIKPGSEIVVTGHVKCESDLPKKCFSEVFKKDAEQKVDYFSCQTCNFNWICRSCMAVCHQDHNVAPYIMEHKPSWACCYCPKKKTCTIQTSG
ncbi:hypothetical protein CHS0354_036496 [Potamilus streckersoni]|uniref:RING-type domain-containing protein n=1 Tax=Potamilus streckersoni TaxID=2493646 RepID=A0AAE0S409_9BIVA|nr:hypothetical protein CHS0354_036496 [Potamilus streckersoni]